MNTLRHRIGWSVCLEKRQWVKLYAVIHEIIVFVCDNTLSVSVYTIRVDDVPESGIQLVATDWKLFISQI